MSPQANTRVPAHVSANVHATTPSCRGAGRAKTWHAVLYEGDTIAEGRCRGNVGNVERGL
eukprot:2688861-Alexandrium_andersonii.AAC.1